MKKIKWWTPLCRPPTHLQPWRYFRQRPLLQTPRQSNHHHLKNRSGLRPSLFFSAAGALIRVFLTSRTDHCSSILHGRHLKSWINDSAARPLIAPHHPRPPETPPAPCPTTLSQSPSSPGSLLPHRPAPPSPPPLWRHPPVSTTWPVFANLQLIGLKRLRNVKPLTKTPVFSTAFVISVSYIGFLIINSKVSLSTLKSVHA